MDDPDFTAAKEDPFGHITSRDLRPEHMQLPDGAVFRSVLYYCVLVLGGPIVAFFGTRYLILVPLLSWGTEEVKTNVVSAIVAGKIFPWNSMNKMKTYVFLLFQLLSCTWHWDCLSYELTLPKTMPKRRLESVIKVHFLLKIILETTTAKNNWSCPPQKSPQHKIVKKEGLSKTLIMWRPET